MRVSYINKLLSIAVVTSERGEGFVFHWEWDLRPDEVDPEERDLFKNTWHHVDGRIVRLELVSMHLPPETYVDVTRGAAAAVLLEELP
jgi:hypothetical protein